MIRVLLFIVLCASAQTVAPSGKGERQPSGGDSSRAVVGGVVRSKEWVIRRSPHREEEFVGDVSYHKGPSLLTADWALFRHEPQTWQARGNVRLRHELKSGDAIEVSGETADFDQGSGKGRLLPRKGDQVYFSRTPVDDLPDYGSAERMDWEGQDRGILSGHVHVWGPRLEARGDRADYDATAKSLRLAGSRPVVSLLQGDWIGAVQADQVTALQQPDRLQADGSARGWIKFKKKLEKLGK